MPQLAKIQINFWDQIYECLVNDLKIEIGDQVVVRSEWGTDIGRVISIGDVSSDQADKKELVSLTRRATTEDLEAVSEIKKQIPAALEHCKKVVDHHNLPMKVIDAHFSFDGSRLVFPFIADGRIDFRQLVKDLTHHFQKSIRLQQIGIRDEAKISGDFGSCGRNLCCKTHLKDLTSITSDLADLQQVAHRGSERLSGMCGRLRCCLAFEEETYRELAKNLPEIGTAVKTSQGRGKVISRHILKNAVSVELEGEDKNIIEVTINKKK